MVSHFPTGTVIFTGKRKESMVDLVRLSPENGHSSETVVTEAAAKDLCLTFRSVPCVLRASVIPSNCKLPPFCQSFPCFHRRRANAGSAKRAAAAANAFVVRASVARGPRRLTRDTANNPPARQPMGEDYLTLFPGSF